MERGYYMNCRIVNGKCSGYFRVRQIGEGGIIVEKKRSFSDRSSPSAVLREMQDTQTEIGMFARGKNAKSN
jgi:hypothetical protein